MKIELREVEKKDWDLVLKLRNEFYEYSFYEQNEPILKDDHYKYMNGQETNPNFHQWIAFDGKNDVGCIRILDQDINIMVEKECQSKGIGTVMLNLVGKAIVIAGNESSKKIFIKNNFKLIMHSFEKKNS